MTHTIEITTVESLVILDSISSKNYENEVNSLIAKRLSEKIERCVKEDLRKRKENGWKEICNNKNVWAISWTTHRIYSHARWVDA